MNLGELRDAGRSTLDDAVKPYLWSDPELDRWANNAVREACLRARMMKDDALTQPALCALPVTAGQPMVTFDPTILVVRSATVAGHGHKLYAVDSDSMDKLRPGWDNGADHGLGVPEYMVMDLAQKKLRLWPAPAADIILRLRVWRVPNENERMEGSSDEPAVAIPDPESLKHWVCFEAYMKKDSETFDAKAAQEHLTLFEHRFGARPSFHEMMRWADSPPRIRAVVMF